MLEDVASRVNISNMTFGALSNLLSHEADTAAAEDCSAVAQLLHHAAGVVHAAAVTHASLGAAERYLLSLNSTNATAFAEELEAADDILLRGPPKLRWAALVGELRVALGESLVEARAAMVALGGVQALVATRTLKVTLGDQRKPLGSAGVVLLVLLALLLLLAAVATVVDGRAGRKAAGRVEAVGRADTTVEPLLLPAAAESSNAVPTAAAPPTTPPAAPTVAPPTAPLATLPAAADAGATADDGATEKSRRRPPSLLSSFSLRRNLVSLTARRANSTMGCLDGLRCLSMAWVILGHTLVYPATEPVGGLQYSERALGTASPHPSHPPACPPFTHTLRPIRLRSIRAVAQGLYCAAGERRRLDPAQRRPLGRDGLYVMAIRTWRPTDLQIG